MQLMQVIGKYVKDRALLTDHGEFTQGYKLYACNLTLDQECADHYFLFKTGNLRVEVQFARVLLSAVTMTVCEVFDNMLEVNRGRNVLFDCM